MFPLPSHNQTPAAQPRLLSLVHASGKKKDTAQVIKKEKLSEYEHMCCAQWCEAPVCSCRECRHAGFFLFFFYLLISACRSSLLPELHIHPKKKNIIKSPCACMCGGGCDTDLYVPFLSMTSCASLALSLSARSDRDGVSTLSREQPERRDLGENSLSQWGAERARVFSLTFIHTAPRRACVDSAV